MLLIKLFNLIKGYVIIAVRGVFVERFLNLCARRSIPLWSIKKSGTMQTTMCMGISDFKRIKEIAKKSNCKVHIVKRVGLPFFIYRHRKRKFLFFGLAASLLIIFMLSRYLWVIDINGNEKIPSDLIEKNLIEAGVSYGKPAKDIDIRSAQNILMTNIPELSWIGINIKGTTAIVTVKERNEVPKALPKDQPCSIVAKTSGVIEKADVKEGERLINIGDVVTKGQILVSGILEGELSGIRYVHSDGEIIARTWHEKTVDLPVVKEIKTPTGKEKSMHSLKIVNFYVKLYFDDAIHFENYETISSDKRITLWNGFSLPLAFHYEKIAEQKLSSKTLTINEAVQEVYKEMDNELLDTQIIKRWYKVNGNKLTVTYECRENIIEKVGF